MEDFEQASTELRRRERYRGTSLPMSRRVTVGGRAAGGTRWSRTDDSETPWKELSRTLVLEVSASGVKWAVATTDISNRLY